MTLTHNERIGRALQLLQDSLKPYVERQLRSVYGNRYHEEMERIVRNGLTLHEETKLFLDVPALLKIMNIRWNEVFSRAVPPDRRRVMRSLIGETQDIRLRWAHPETPFDLEDAYRALDTIERLLAELGASEEALVVKKMKQDLWPTGREAASWNRATGRENAPRQSAAPPLEKTSPPQLSNSEIIMSTTGLTAAQVTRKKVMCPGCGQKVFQQWPLGWDAHAASKCSGITGHNEEERKAVYKSRFRHLFK